MRRLLLLLLLVWGSLLPAAAQQTDPYCGIALTPDSLYTRLLDAHDRNASNLLSLANQYLAQTDSAALPEALIDVARQCFANTPTGDSLVQQTLTLLGHQPDILQRWFRNEPAGSVPVPMQDLLQYAQFRAQAGRPQLASTWLQQVETLSLPLLQGPQQFTFQLHLQSEQACNWSAARQPDEAHRWLQALRTHLDSALRQHPTDYALRNSETDYTELAAEVALNAGNLTEAQRLLESIAASRRNGRKYHPDAYAHWLNLHVLLAYRQDKPLAALPWLRRLQALQTTDYGRKSVAEDIADMYLDAGQYAAAARLYRRLIQQSARDTDYSLGGAYAGYASALAQTGDYHRAEEWARRGLQQLERHPNPYGSCDAVHLYEVLMKALVQQGKTAEAAALAPQAETQRNQCPF